MVAKRPEDRQQSMSAVIAELQSLATEPVVATAKPAAEKKPDDLSAFFDKLARKPSGTIADTPPTHEVAATITLAPAERPLKVDRSLRDRNASSHGVTRLLSHPRVLVAGALAALVLLATIIIIIRNKEGKEVARLEVPDGSQIEITQDQSRMGTPARPSIGDNSKTTSATDADGTGKSAHPTTDPDRAAAEWVLAQKTASFVLARVQITGQPGPAKVIQRGQPLPDQPFQVVEFSLVGTDITDHDLARFLPRLNSLIRLDISDGKSVTDASVATLREIRSLIFVDVSGTSLTPPACLELIRTLPLEYLSLSGRKLTPELLDLVCATPRVKQVGLRASTTKLQLGIVTDEQLKSLFRAKQLMSLQFIDVTADMATWRELPDSLPNLTQLHVQGKHFTDAHLTEFVRLAKLDYLGLIRTAITDAGLPALYNSRALRRLDLTGTAVTAEGVAALHERLPLCQITWDGGILEPEPK
ncbi:MAG: hypothetical protein O3C40_33395 [Planctomycetota bacterium]|nr:hypothetical protein [Planctomycetota bacterium]